MYESPIEIIYENVQTQFEDAVLKAVQKVGINVDKDELIKALNYDRGQYEKGYSDRDSEIVRCKDCEYGHEIVDVNGLYFIVCGNPFGHGIAVENDGFCKWGRRKENE